MNNLIATFRKTHYYDFSALLNLETEIALAPPCTLCYKSYIVAGILFRTNQPVREGTAVLRVANVTSDEYTRGIESRTLKGFLTPLFST